MPTPRADTTPACTPQRPARSRFIPVRSLRYHLLSWDAADTPAPVRTGPAEPPTAAGPVERRPPLVMVHGWMDVAASFQFVVDALARLDAQPRAVFAPDWRGFGLTETPGADTYWFPDYLADLDALLDHISPDAPVDLIGHSMGGNVVMSYAGVRPDRVRRLVNLEGFGLPETRPAQAPARLLQWLDQLKQPTPLRDYASLDEVAARLRKNNPRLSASKAAWLAPHWAGERVAPDGSRRWHIRGDPAHKRVNPVLYRKDEVLETWRRIACPVLWVEGDSTDLAQWWGDRYPRADFEARLAQVPRLQRTLLAECGHMLHHDQPEALAAQLHAFLDAA